MTVQDLAAEIAAALGTGWEVAETDEPMTHGHHIYNAEGVCLFIHDQDLGYARSNEKGKIRIDGSPHKIPGFTNEDGPHRYHLSGDKRPEIMVSKSRGAATIAKEIRRRLLDDVVREHNETVERIAKRQANERSQQRTVEELAAMIPGAYVRGGTVSTRIGSGSMYGDFTVRHDGERIEANIRGLSVEQAKRIATVLAETP
jgi:hypothetical protein